MDGSFALPKLTGSMTRNATRNSRLLDYVIWNIHASLGFYAVREADINAGTENLRFGILLSLAEHA